MSVVTNIILSGHAGCYSDLKLGPGCRIVVEALNSWLQNPVTDLNPEPEVSLGRLEPVDGLAGGTRAMETNLWIGAFNYLPVPEFIEVFQCASAKIRGLSDKPQMLMKRQDDSVFTDVPPVSDGRWWHYRERELDVMPSIQGYGGKL